MKKSIVFLGIISLTSSALLGAKGVFANTDINSPNPANAKTPVTSILTINETPEKPVAPIDPDQGGSDQDTNITGLFGIAYAPGTLTGNGELETNGQTTIDLANSTANNPQNKHNVGVQDKTRAKDRGWTLKAQLVWDGDPHRYMSGSKITGAGGTLQLNNKGSLNPISDNEVTTTATSLEINTESQTDIMQAQTGKTVNGVYNYQFKDPKLVIPNSENVAAGTYSGNIVWTLSNAMG